MRRWSLTKADTESILTRWLAAAPPSAPTVDDTLAEACHDLVASITTGAWARVDGALRRFGLALGRAGWLLEEVTEWVGVLADDHALTRSQRGAMVRFASGASLGSGWSRGFLDGFSQSGCTEPLTGLVTLPVMRLRLEQVYKQCRAVGVVPAAFYRLIVIDPDVERGEPFEREASLMVLASIVRDRFDTGETIAFHAGRILVLASTADSDDDTLYQLVVELKSSHLDGSDPIVWTEELPGDLILIDRFLLDLTAPML